MPELAEVQILASQLRKKILGLKITDVRIFQEALLTIPKETLVTALAQKQILDVFRRGKFLCLQCGKQRRLWLHLGMTGQLLFGPAGEAEDRHLHIRIHFENTPDVLALRDVRKFGQIRLTCGSQESFTGGRRFPGPDPFELTGSEFTGLFEKRRGRIKSLLLNQHLMAGLGNIYADESLFRAGIRPSRRAFSLGAKRLRRLHQAICETLAEAIERGGSSIDDFIHLDGGSGGFQKFHRVYGRSREECTACGNFIRRIRLAGRSSHFCPRCQK